MDILVAIGHIAGALLTMLVLSIVVVIVSAWEIRRNQRQALEDASIALGVAVEDLESDEFTPKVVQLSASRYSRELLRNRLSDFCGVLRAAWGWMGLLVQAGIVIAVAWDTFTGNPATAVNAWWIIAVALFFWLASVIFSLVCRLLTGRFPGEARQSRKSLTMFMSDRHKRDATSPHLGG